MGITKILNCKFGPLNGVALFNTTDPTHKYYGPGQYAGSLTLALPKTVNASVLSSENIKSIEELLHSALAKQNGVPFCNGLAYAEQGSDKAVTKAKVYATSGKDEQTDYYRMYHVEEAGDNVYIYLAAPSNPKQYYVNAEAHVNPNGSLKGEITYLDVNNRYITDPATIATYTDIANAIQDIATSAPAAA